MSSDRLTALVLALAAVVAPARALAFADPYQFFADPQSPHGATFGAVAEGVYFTGTARFASRTCSDCHVEAPGRIGLRVGADPATLFDDGYQPGKIYQLVVELTGEQAGTQHGGASCTEPPGPRDSYAYVQCNNNNFALEIDDAAGVPLAGPAVFCAQPPLAGVCPMPDGSVDEALVAPDGDAVFGNRALDPDQPKVVRRNGARVWHLWWTAPAAGTGPVTIAVAAVDGNGGAGSAANDQDPFGDDTVQASIYVPEAGAPSSRSARAGCQLGAGSAPVTPAAVVLLLPVVLLLVRRRSVSAADGARARRSTAPPSG